MRGRTSKYWEITFYGSRWTGSSQFHMDYFYECGVNIPNASDETCSTWKSDGAQGHGSGVAVNKQQIVKNFGRHDHEAVPRYRRRQLSQCTAEDGDSELDRAAGPADPLAQTPRSGPSHLDPAPA
ncbi:hypothetical protein [Streptomyces sp. Agncl-13]|uniref:hypothetical protein n=1 Tax=Streptomyces sp. Agncl-13 TaxID=3400628 RepID=UPI003A8C183F